MLARGEDYREKEFLATATQRIVNATYETSHPPFGVKRYGLRQSRRLAVCWHLKEA